MATLPPAPSPATPLACELTGTRVVCAPRRRNEFLEAQAARMGQQMLDLEAQNKDLVQRVATLQTIEQQLESMLESDHQIQVRARSMHA